VRHYAKVAVLNAVIARSQEKPAKILMMENV
jgi:hypothetical protein